MMDNAQKDDEDEIDPTKTRLFDDDEDDTVSVTDGLENSQEMQHYYLRSIDSAVVIRQLPSEGIPFQLWPAAKSLVALLDDLRCEPTTSPLASVFNIGGERDRVPLPQFGSRITAELNLVDTASDLQINADGDRRRIKILELGSGTGLVGIAAALTLGAEVTVTDLPHVISNLQFNAEANSALLTKLGGEVHSAALRWGEADDVTELIKKQGEFDVVLASDVVYHDHLFEPLLKTLRLLILESEGEKEIVFVMAHLRRWGKESAFFKKAKKLFEVEVLHAVLPDEGKRIGVTIYRFTKRSK